MKRSSIGCGLVLAALLLISAAACAPAPTAVPPTAVPPPTTAPVATTALAATKAPEATKAPAAATSTTAATAAPTATSIRAALGSASGCHLILSTTTSTQDSGLLGFILPAFEKQYNCKVDVVAVGTGQAIAIGQKGDADVLLVHDRPNEDKFVADKNARERFDVMYNDFIIVGSKNDPAKITGMKMAKDAFKAIMETKTTFASRGDKSGTNSKELSIWATLNVTPTKDLPWYNALGQGMGETLLFSNDKGAYTLTDRATWLAQQSKLSGLVVLVGGNNINENADKNLHNPYGVMAVNPDKFPGVKYDMAMNFVKWITGLDEQKVINSYGVDKYGQQLFFASAAEYLKSLTPTAPTSTPTK
jgi:tungstate transport system substrate-binding protein